MEQEEVREPAVWMSGDPLQQRELSFRQMETAKETRVVALSGCGLRKRRDATGLRQ